MINASEYGHRDIAMELMARGADLNIQNKVSYIHLDIPSYPIPSHHFISYWIISFTIVRSGEICPLQPV